MSVVPLYYSCYSSESFSKEQFVTDHFFSYLISGTYRVSDSEKEYELQPECFCLIRRNRLATFKRDFKKTFHETPGKWLLKRRLKEAYYLIDSEKQKPSDVYLELGFEDLSHFSFTFKKEFGVNPSSLI